MDTHHDIDSQLARAWQKLYMTHLLFESTHPNTSEYKQRWDDLIEAMHKYNRVVQHMDPAMNKGAAD